MSVSDTLEALAARLRMVNPAPEPPPQLVLPSPKGAVNLAEFPAIVLALSPSGRHTWGLHGNDLARHRYTVAGWVFLGAPSATNLPELHARVLPWPAALATVLLGDITLGGQIDQLGDEGDQLFSYTVGGIRWGGKDYFGLSFELGIQEKPSVVIG